MQRSSTTASSSISSSAQTALRRQLRKPGTPIESLYSNDDHDEISDPRPWETRAPLNTYGSRRDPTHVPHPSLSNPSFSDRDLPIYGELGSGMETRRRHGEKEDVLAKEEDEKRGLIHDDQGKWDSKGHGPGPGLGGKRGLPPKQRISGWVSSRMYAIARADCSVECMLNSRTRFGLSSTPYSP